MLLSVKYLDLNLWRRQVNKILLTIRKLVGLLALTLIACEDTDKQSSQTPLTATSSVEIYLENTLDEPRGFCLDIVGFKSNADPNKGLQAHTCYSYQGSVAIDQGFDLQKMNEKSFYIPGFEVCMQVESTEIPSEISLNPCTGSDKQKFDFNDNGKIYLEVNKNLCLTISKDNSRQGGGGNPVHLIRDVKIEMCNPSFEVYQRWGRRIN